MIYNGLIVPHEHPITMREIKRALITYDKTYIPHPGDRDFMPSSLYNSQIMGMGPIGMSSGPVKRLGKTNTYDADFEKVYEKCKPAIKQGLISIGEVFDPTVDDRFTIGSVSTGGFPLKAKFAYGIFESLSRNQAALFSAIKSEMHILLKLAETEKNISTSGVVDGTLKIGLGEGKEVDLTLPNLNLENLSRAENEYLTRIARARIASLIKYSGFCEKNDIIPIFKTESYSDLSSHMVNNSRSIFKAIPESEDTYWHQISRALDISHEETLIDNKLDELSLNQVLKLRTKVWGKQAEDRNSLFKSVKEISLEIKDKDQFEAKSRAKITEYVNKTELLCHEREVLNFKVFCDLATATVAIPGVVASIGGLSHFEFPGTIGLALASGSAWLLKALKEHLPQLEKWKISEKHLNKTSAFGFYKYYSKID